MTMLDYAEHAGTARRKKFGQFFTHPAVARFMADWVSRSPHREVFDPAFGLGALREPLSKRARKYFSAMELDPEIVKFWTRKSRESADFVEFGDYLRAWGARRGNIVCNPPYMRFQKFLNRDAVFSDFQERLGIRLSGYTNTASAFLLKSLAELEPGGRLAYIMPLEFLNTGYGEIVKRRLLAGRHLCAIISLACEKEAFPDAVTSAGIILCDTATRCDSVGFYSLDALRGLAEFDRLAPAAVVPCADLDPAAKWLPFLRRKAFAVDADNTAPLHFFGRFSRGIATGANEFFAVNRSRIAAWRLDEARDCVPCITKAAQIGAPFFEERDLRRLQAADKPVFLFAANGGHSSGATAYIEDGVRRGYHTRYLTRHRRPWYKAEARQPSPLLLGVFSRGGYKIVLNTSGAVNLTCYHGFQPNLFGEKYVNHLFLYLSSEAGRTIVSLAKRQYGDALDKFEPNDINGALAPAPRVFDQLPPAVIDSALAEYRRTRKVPRRIERLFGALVKSAA